MVTIEDCRNAWNKFNEVKEHAEQYMFPKILLLDLKLTPAYKDLEKNWDERHGEIFIRVMTKVLKEFGITYVLETKSSDLNQ